MNGIFDMGGMQDMGPIAYEKDEPVFHARWEGRMRAINNALGAWRKWNIDAWRHALNLLPPAEYLRNSYYENNLAQIERLLVERGLVTSAEITSGKPERGRAKVSPALRPDGIMPLLALGTVSNRNVRADAHFKVGQPVRARNMNPVGHTRLPRYARGKSGTIDRDHGVFVYPDTNALSQGEKPQHVYSVRFAARELWGDQAMPSDSVYVDLWDDYLEPA
jgi:nitrile hydratase beta subunit